jgi:pSer/pThr/pTyr-binding forkhead associated (FHA) protein
LIKVSLALCQGFANFSGFNGGTLEVTVCSIRVSRGTTTMHGFATSNPAYPTLIELPQDGHLFIIDDAAGTRQFILERDYYVIGRAKDCSIRLLSKFASRYHATLTRLPGSDGSSCYQLLDGFDGKQSVNGLRVNGKQVKSHQLQNHDVVVFGPGVQVTYYCLTQKEFLEDADDLTPYEPSVPETH